METYRLARRIRAFRKLKGHTQQEMADLLGLSVAVYGSVERGTRQVDGKLIGYICRTLGIDPDELTTDRGFGQI